MRALVLRETLALERQYKVPRLKGGEALLRVLCAGICNTDIELCRGYRTFSGVLGHELVAVVKSLPSGARGLAIGDRVVAEINCVPAGSSSHSAFLRAQDPARTTLGIAGRDGAFADFVAVPVENLHRVPDGVRTEEAVFVEPLAAACQLLVQVAFRPEQRVIVLGDGKLGQLCAQVIAAATACELLVIGKHASKLELLRRRGISTLLLPNWEGRRAADIVVECTGTPPGFELARRMLHPRGTLILKSTYAQKGVDVSAFAESMTRIVVDEITVVGSRCGPFAAALRLLAEKRVDVLPLVSATFDLEDGVKAFAHAQEAGVLKVLLNMGIEKESLHEHP